MGRKELGKTESKKVESNKLKVEKKVKSKKSKVVKPTGIKVGEITEAISKAIRRQKRYIYLESEDDKKGTLKIERTHAKEISKTGLSSIDFVKLVCTYFNEIYSDNKGAILLVYKNGVDKVAVVRLTINDYYTVITAFPIRRNWLKVKRLLWSKGAHSESKSDLGSAIHQHGKSKSESHEVSAHSHKSLTAKLQILDKWLLGEKKAKLAKKQKPVKKIAVRKKVITRNL